MPYKDYSYDRYRDPGRYKAMHGYKGGGRRKSRFPFILGAFVIIIAVAVASGMVFASRVDANLHGFTDQDQAELDASLSATEPLASAPFNVLLLGSDARVDDPDMGARTDAIVLARVDPAAKTVKMVSIPRDTMIDIEGVGPSKINAAYTFGGADGAVRAVENLCNVKIDHCAVVDFEGLSKLVDSIGGVDVFLEEGIDDPLAGTATIGAGQQHINGEQALVMSRSRDWADGDYTRQLNQRKVIWGILNRIMDLPLWEMPSAIEGMSKCVATDSGITSAGAIAQAMKMKSPGDELQISMVSLPSEPAYIGDVSYVIADTAATAELMHRLMTGGDIEAPLTESSIEYDLAEVGAWQ